MAYCSTSVRKDGGLGCTRRSNRTSSRSAASIRMRRISYWGISPMHESTLGRDACSTVSASPRSSCSPTTHRKFMRFVYQACNVFPSYHLLFRAIRAIADISKRKGKNSITTDSGRNRTMASQAFGALQICAVRSLPQNTCRREGRALRSGFPALPHCSIACWHVKRLPRSFATHAEQALLRYCTLALQKIIPQNSGESGRPCHLSSTFNSTISLHQTSRRWSSRQVIFTSSSHFPRSKYVLPHGRSCNSSSEQALPSSSIKVRERARPSS